MPEQPPPAGTPAPPPTPRPAHIERWWRLDEWRSEHPGHLRFAPWMGALGAKGVAWQEGPFPLMLHDPDRVAVELLGETPAHFFANESGFTVYGPWRVVVRSFGSEPERRVLASWSMRWVQATTPMIERWGQLLERRIESAYGRTLVFEGASESHVVTEGGASERWRIGASERMWIGASEWALGGASESGRAGASRFALAGASAEFMQGASERMGASERAGVSDWSERQPGERWGGRLDGKEGR
jgi:hypothetical protein